MRDYTSLENIVRFDKTNRDYCTDLVAAKDLAKRIEGYWHKQGYESVRVWVEGVALATGSKRWEVRGNILYNCNHIQRDLLPK